MMEPFYNNILHDLLTHHGAAALGSAPLLITSSLHPVMTTMTVQRLVHQDCMKRMQTGAKKGKNPYMAWSG